MKLEEIHRLIQETADSYGLSFRHEEGRNEGGQIIQLFLEGVHKAESFKIEIHIKWHSIEILFIPGNLAKGLLTRMSNISLEDKYAFSGLADEIKETGATLMLKINSIEQNFLEPESWPGDWEQLEFKLTTGYISSDEDLSVSIESFEHVKKWLSKFLDPILYLLPLAPVEVEYGGELEGSPSQQQSILYERSRRNRTICIQLQGTRCKVCETNLGDVYGHIGAGFIHIHHVIPVHQGEYRFNPAKDLAPVCPNCHSMLHRKEPPYTIEEMKVILNENIANDYLQESSSQ